MSRTWTKVPYNGEEEQVCQSFEEAGIGDDDWANGIEEES